MASNVNVKLPLGSVVVGVDGSAQSMDAVTWAAAQAAMEHRPLVIAHATGAVPPVLGIGVHVESTRQQRRIVGRRHVDAALEKAHQVAPGLRVQTMVRSTSATLLLLALAERAHMVVVGSRGLGPIGSVALRSVSVAVASGADTPVVVVRTPPDSAQTGRIVVGVDGTASSAEALAFGFAQASARGVPLTAVHCSAEADRSLLAESMAGLQEKYPDVAAEQQVARAEAAECLIDASSDADLVVVGSRGHHGPGASFLGSVSQLVVERAHCSVAVVHPTL